MEVLDAQQPLGEKELDYRRKKESMYQVDIVVYNHPWSATQILCKTEPFVTSGKRYSPLEFRRVAL
jgi:hypothetical protein